MPLTAGSRVPGGFETGHWDACRRRESTSDRYDRSLIREVVVDSWRYHGTPWDHHGGPSMRRVVTSILLWAICRGFINGFIGFIDGFIGFSLGITM